MDGLRIILIIGIVVVFTGYILIMILLYRNEAVSRYRFHIIDLISQHSQEDIRQRREWVWRHDVYHSVSYNEMVIKFWKPLESFYPDKSFIEEGKS